MTTPKKIPAICEEIIATVVVVSGRGWMKSSRRKTVLSKNTTEGIFQEEVTNFLMGPVCLSFSSFSIFASGLVTGWDLRAAIHAAATTPDVLMSAGNTALIISTLSFWLIFVPLKLVHIRFTITQGRLAAVQGQLAEHSIKEV